MKVYTHYQAIDDCGNGYRWRTLLQFGNSWDIIGSVVMKNPGSANFKNGKDISITDSSLLANLAAFEYPGDEGKEWFEFKGDQTMYCVAELFALYYNVPDKMQLNGVIQIFNLFYLKEQDLGKALKTNKELAMLGEINDTIFKHDIVSIKAPIYLGFGKLAKSSDFRDKAEAFFSEAVVNHAADYLDKEFDANSFTHPLALMRYYKDSPANTQTRNRFCAGLRC
ncbi:MAG: hypothetical protein IJP80_04730 [Bacteroidales bacterium]|nr:hypothetical protein [Bacteroidales bacterium]